MKVMSGSYIFVMALFITISSCSTVPKSPIPELQTVAFVDMDRYLGKWYEIARYPHSFEEECYGATAFYKKKKDGTIKVINQCRLLSRSPYLDPEILKTLKLKLVNKGFILDHLIMTPQ